MQQKVYKVNDEVILNIPVKIQSIITGDKQYGTIDKYKVADKKGEYIGWFYKKDFEIKNATEIKTAEVLINNNINENKENYLEEEEIIEEEIIEELRT